jgi:adenylate cyclase
MSSKREFLLYRNVLENMSDGVIAINLTGGLVLVNAAAREILGLDATVSDGEHAFDDVFAPFELDENEAFFDAIIQATYESNVTQNRLVNFKNPTTDVSLELSMATSFLQTEVEGKEEVIGVIAVFRDITEINELRDALKAMEKIKELNVELDKRNKFIRKAFGKYVSDEVVDVLLESPEGLNLGGDKRKTTVIMTDLRGFSAMSERLDPERILESLNNFFQAMTDVVFHYNGTINKFIGDAVMILFGAPINKEDDALRAVACAIDMQNAMAEVNKKNGAAGLPQFEMGIGINTGEVIAGNMGSDKRTEYGVLGRTVNLASRIESLTVGGQILISDETLKEAGSAVRIGPSYETSFKGIERKVQVFEVEGVDGPYDLTLVSDAAEIQPLATPTLVQFSLLEGKSSASDGEEGLIVALSHSSAHIQMDEEIEPFTNCRFNLTLHGGDAYFYGKVKKQLPSNAYLVRFTAVSEEARAIFDQIGV